MVQFRQKTGEVDVDKVENQKSLLGIALEGPSRIGHYFRPVYSGAADGMYALKPDGPIIRPDGKPRHWTVHYDPNAADGNGRITVTLDDEKTEMDLKPGVKSSGATFDRFGFVDMQTGGHYVKVFIDDVKFTTKPAGQGEAR
jgi:hypothetical protein